MAPPVEKNLVELCQQIEFWMGNSNLPNDKFLMNYIEKNDGWIPIDVFLKFNKLKSQGIDKVETLVEAIKKSPKLLIINKEETSVKRTIPMPTKEETAERLTRLIQFRILPENLTDSELIKSKLEQFGKTLYFSHKKTAPTYKRKQKAVFHGTAEFSSISQIQKLQKWDKKFTFGPEKKEFTFEIEIESEIRIKKVEERRKEMLRGFSKEKIFEVRNFPAGIYFTQLRKLVSEAVFFKKENSEGIKKKAKIENIQNDENNENDKSKTEKNENKQENENDTKIEEKGENDQKKAKKDENGEKKVQKDQNDVKIDENDTKKDEKEENKPIKVSSKLLQPMTPLDILKLGRITFNGDIIIPQTKDAETKNTENNPKTTQKDTKTVEKNAPKNNPYAIFRIKDESEMTSMEVKKALEMREKGLEVVTFEGDEKKAMEKWIEGIEAYALSAKKGKSGKRFGKKKRRRD